MRYLLRHLLFGLGALLFIRCGFTEPTAPTPPNVLFIAIDDLRPELGCYGESHMQTPHLDGLAAEGRLFNRHYVQVPTCGASRFALLMGRYPQHVKHTSNQVFRDELATAKAEGWQTLPQVFRAGGYHTVGLGKISHYVDGLIYSYDGEGDGRLEMPDSWDECWGPVGKWGTAWNAFFGYADGSNRNGKAKKGSPTEFVAESDDDLPDGLIAQKAVSTLQALKERDEPFFMAVGFLKPHLPFVAPKKYWDLYDDVTIPLSPNPDVPEGVAPMALHRSGEMFGNYQDQPETGGLGVRLSDDRARYLRRAYAAAVSYIDAQVGRVLAALEETGLDENTIVVVWGDHGWHLGDHTIWGKHTLFDRALRSALIVKTPAQAWPGEASDAIVETVDLFPTLTELCGLRADTKLSGQSLVPMINDPSRSLDKPALGFWRRGYTLRSEQYRLTHFYGEGARHTEFYDHGQDPWEAKNLADMPPYADVIEQLTSEMERRIPSGFRASLP